MVCSIHPRHLAQRELRRLIVQEAALLHGKLLDVGCGKKPYAELIQVDAYIGLDVPTSMHCTSFTKQAGASNASMNAEGCG